MDKMVEIARFQYPAEAQMLVSLLKSEGIDCYIRNEISSQVMAGYADIGGARVEILESDVPQALDIMQAGGYEIPNESEQPEPIQQVGGWASRIPFIRHYAFEKQIIIILAIVSVLLGLLLFFSSIFSSEQL